MQLRELYTDDRAVSPVVGVALLIAIAVILAAVIGAVVLGLGTGGVDTPQAQLQGDFNTTNGDLEDFELSHNGGEPIPADEVTIVTDAGGELQLEDVDEYDDDELTAGESVSVNATDDTAPNEDGEIDDGTEEVTIVWEDPNSDSETVLEEFSK